MTHEQKAEKLPRRRKNYSLTIVFISMFALTGANIAYTTRAVNKNAQVWCGLVAPLDDQYKATPPPTAGGKVFARGIHEVRIQYHCK